MIGAFLRAQGLEVVLGVCTFCGDAVPRTGKKPAIRCTRSECVRAYFNAYNQYAKGRAPTRPIVTREQLGPRLWLVQLDCGHGRIIRGQCRGTTARCSRCKRANAQRARRAARRVEAHAHA